MNPRIKLALIASLLTSVAAPSLSMAQVIIEKTVAVVAGEPISQTELNERVKINREVAKRNKQKPTNDQLMEYSRDELINERLMLNKVKNANINIDQATVNNALLSMAQGNGMDIEQFQAMVAKQGGANAWESLNSDLKNQLAIDQLMRNEITNKIKQPSDAEIQAEVERVSAVPDGPMSSQPAAVAQHIFIKGATPASLKKITAIKARITAGEDFGSVAKEVSENPQTAPNEGKVPYILLNDSGADANVLKLANNAPLNEVSAPIKTKNGYHLFKFSDRITLSLSDDEKSAMAKEALLAMRQKEAAEQFYKEVEVSKASLVEIKN